MGVMMILVSQIKGLDGVENAEPSQFGIVVELTDRAGLEAFLDGKSFIIKEDVHEHSEMIRKSNPYIRFGTPNELVRVIRG